MRRPCCSNACRLNMKTILIGENTGIIDKGQPNVPHTYYNKVEFSCQMGNEDMAKIQHEK
jgi:hypothetical protein